MQDLCKVSHFIKRVEGIDATQTDGDRGKWLYRSYLVGNAQGSLSGRWRDVLSPQTVSSWPLLLFISIWYICRYLDMREALRWAVDDDETIAAGETAYSSGFRLYVIRIYLAWQMFQIEVDLKTMSDEYLCALRPAFLVIQRKLTVRANTGDVYRQHAVPSCCSCSML